MISTADPFEWGDIIEEVTKEFNNEYIIEVLYEKFFIGYNPPGFIFGPSLDGLCDMVKNKDDITFYSGIVETAALISLVAYFEAFCKNYFAAALNLCPYLLRKFIDSKNRNNESINLKDLILVDFDLKYNLGTLVSDKYDFGDPQKINSLYFDLLNFSPFSTNEKNKFNELLELRNILVHHGSIIPVKYAHLKKYSLSDEVIVTVTKFYDYASFLEGLVVKITQQGVKQINKYISENSIQLDDEKKATLPFIACYNDILR